MLAHQEKFKIFGYKVPQYFWFVVSGALCDVFQAVVDYIISIFYVLQWEKPTICWTLSYIISIWLRHSSHRVLVFGEFEGTYCASLTKTYFTYSSSIVISMVTNHFIVEFLHFSHRDAWIITMLWTGIVNYFLLKASWRTKAKDSSPVLADVL